MARKKAETIEEPLRMFKPALTEQGRENQMISLAVDLAERQLREGTASSQVITHFLKLGTEREKLAREKLRKENRVLEEKANAYKQAENIEALYKEAISAMKDYAGLSGGAPENEE